MKKRNKRGVLRITTIVLVVIIISVGSLMDLLIQKLEKGVLEVCATQQEAYVQLVVDQINLKQNRDEEEIISDILSTLDASSNKYWMFSKDRSILFVKDVIETNRYKGITTMSYYDSSSAREFLNNLRTDRVIHRNIDLAGKKYIASGVEFEYKDELYRLCLLTNQDVILNNNYYMEATLQTIILVAFILMLLLASSMLFARKQEAQKAEIRQRDEEIEKLQKMVGDLNELVSQKEHFDTRYQVWNKDALADFLQKLRKRNVKEVVIAKLNCNDGESQKNFLEKASVLLGKQVLRFADGNENIILLFVKDDEVHAREKIKPLLSEAVFLHEVKTHSLLIAE